MTGLSRRGQEQSFPGDRNVPYIDRVMVIWVHTFIKTQTM